MNGAFKLGQSPVEMMSELTPPKAKPAGKFVPGKQGKPRSGMTAHEIMNNPEHLRRIATLVEQHEREHGGKKLTGPRVKSMMQQVVGDISDSQARTLSRKFQKLMKQRVT